MKSEINNKINLAIAEDNILSQMLFTSVVQKHGGFNLLKIAPNGEELLEWLAHAPIPPDACILDYHMPILNGVGTAKRLRKDYANILLFGCTSSTIEKEKREMIDIGFIAVFYKETQDICKLLEHIILH